MLFRAITFVSLYSFVLAELKLEQLVGISYVNYRFNTDQERQDYINNQHYHNCSISGIKVASDGTIFVSVPRWKENVPATLAVLDLSDTTVGPVLVPFPNWETNLLTTQDGLISVLGFEIDSDDNIWALDAGRVVNDPGTDTSTKLVKFDRKGEKLDTIYLGSAVDHVTSFMNDLVYDKKHNYIYIADSGSVPGILAVNLNTKTATKYLYSHESVLADDSIWLIINGQKVFKDKTIMTGADGIALSCDGNTLYYTPLTSRMLYSISTDILRSGDTQKAIANVKTIGYKRSASGGLIMSARNRLYMTALEDNAVYMSSSLGDGPEDFNYKRFSVVAQDDDLVWQDTLAIDKKSKKLYIVTNKLQDFLDGTMEFDLSGKVTNFRIWTVNIDDYSYVEGCYDEDDDDDSADALLGWGLGLIAGLLIL
jgi:sugar lactone lactonase YvrE